MEDGVVLYHEVELIEHAVFGLIPVQVAVSLLR